MFFFFLPPLNRIFFLHFQPKTLADITDLPHGVLFMRSHSEILAPLGVSH